MATRRKKASKKSSKKSSKKAARKMVCPKTVGGRKVRRLSNGACMVKPKKGGAKFVKKVRAGSTRRSR